MSTNQSIKLEINKEDDTYYLTGAINEHASFDVPAPINSVLKLDLAAIDFINSIGTRSWVLFLKSHEGCDIQFHRVSLTMMNAISMMPMLLPKGAISTIKSFYLPYCCMNCSETTLRCTNFQELDITDDSVYTDLITCSTCGNPATLSEEESEFLALFVDFGFGTVEGGQT